MEENRTYPGMDKTGNISEHTEDDIYDRIARTDSSFDPDCNIVSDMSRVVIIAGRYIPPRGGKRMERAHKNRSGPSHILKRYV
jgi:hypothetical protein